MSITPVVFGADPNANWTALFNAIQATTSPTDEVVISIGAGGTGYAYAPLPAPVITKACVVRAATQGPSYSHPFWGDDTEFFTRTITIWGLIKHNIPTLGQNIDYRDIRFRIPKGIRPDFKNLGETWQSKVYTPYGVSAMLDFNQGGNGGVILHRVEFEVGLNDNDDGSQRFVPGTKYPGFYSPTTYYGIGDNQPDAQGRWSATSQGAYTHPFSVAGWGDPTTGGPNQNGLLIYNDLLAMPGCINGNVSHFEAYDCYVHDCCVGFGMTEKQGVACTYIRKGGCFERNLLFDEQSSLIGAQSVPARQEGGKFRGTMVNVHDLGNPHRDFNETVMNPGTGAIISGRRTILYRSNFIAPEQSDRGQATLRFQPNGGGPDHPRLVASQFYFNTFVEGAGIQLDNDIVDGDIAGNICVSRLWDTPSYRGGDVYTSPCLIWYLYKDPIPGSPTPNHVGRIEGNLCEDRISTDGHSSVVTGNKVVPVLDAAAASAALVNPTAAPATAADLFANVRTKPGAVSVPQPWTSYADWKANRYNFSSIPCHAKVLDQYGVNPGGGKVTSNIEFKHGGDWGDAHTITLPAGLECREYEYDGVTVAQDWFTGAGQLHTGKCFQLRMTPAATNSTPKALTYTVGDRSFTWTTVTKSNNKHFGCDVDGTRLVNTAGLKQLVNGIVTAVPAGHEFSMFFIIENAGTQDPAQQGVLFQETGGSEGYNSCYVNNYNFSVQCEAQPNDGTPNFVLGQAGGPNNGGNPIGSGTYVFAVSVKNDAAGGEFGGGMSVWQNGVDVTATQAQVFHAALVTRFDQIWSLFESYFYGQPTSGNYKARFKGRVRAMGIHNEFIDWSVKGPLLDPNNPDRIGPAFEALTPSGKPFLVPLVGHAAKINAGTGSLNPLNPFVLDPGTRNGNLAPTPAVDAGIVGAVLPGTHLNMTAQVLTANPQAGQPVDVLIQFSGVPATTVITPTWGGVTRLSADGAKTHKPLDNGVILSATPSAVGNLTLDLANDQQHTNPAQLVIPIVRTIPFTILPGPGRSGAPLQTSITVAAPAGGGGLQGAD